MFEVPASTTLRTFHSICRAMHSSSSPDCRDPASRASHSTRSLPRASAGMSRASRHMRASSSVRWTSLTLISSKGCPRLYPSTRSRPRATRVRQSEPSPRCTTISGFSSLASVYRTAPSAVPSSRVKLRSRSSTKYSNCRLTHASRSSPLSCANARVSTASCFDSSRPRGSPACVSTARWSALTRCRPSRSRRSTRSRSSSTGSP